MFLQHLLSSHTRYTETLANAERFGIHIVQYMAQVVGNLASMKRCPVDELTKDLHVYPDFHGNRSPLADPQMRGMISGRIQRERERELVDWTIIPLRDFPPFENEIDMKTNEQSRRFAVVQFGGGFRVAVLCWRPSVGVSDEAYRRSTRTKRPSRRIRAFVRRPHQQSSLRDGARECAPATRSRAGRERGRSSR